MAEVRRRLERTWPEALAPHTRFSALVLRLAALLRDNSEHILRTQNLTFKEFETLAALRIHALDGPLVPSNLYDAILISSGGLTKVLKTLEHRALIKRGTDDRDTRRRPFSLTPQGRAAVDAAFSALREADKAFLGDALASEMGLSALIGQLETILPILEKRRRPRSGREG
ncbi:MAG: hypothetical protein K9H25_11630 [Rhodospirillum sp.]|nr:hypothetical protein [Rhodospirillum sp.]MCF8489899.1 hypothetical protein [Rhodospirillum sp.]MCF8502963.1 hypothetical protein [Rhodospirillum sp.]